VAHAGSAGVISLEQWIALNDEITGLVRADVPLERALGEIGGDLPGRLGRITRAVAERMAQGRSLDEALADEPERFPPVYRAVVLAGLRSGRLAGALESVSRTARRLAETRRLVAGSFLYPLIVLLVAWVLFVFFIMRICPVLLGLMNEYDVLGRGLLGRMAAWGDSAAYWGPFGPILIVAAAWIWWSRSARASLVQPRSACVWLGWLPWLGPMLRAHRVAAFAEILALLVENDAPLPESVVLAAEAAGDRRMIRAAGEVSEALKRGEPWDGRTRADRAFPPMLRWLMTTGQRRGALLPALRHAADTYQRRARRYADSATIFLPVVITAVVAGGAVLMYAILLFAPWTLAIQHLSGM